jgi:hypothetical protein
LRPLADLNDEPGVGGPAAGAPALSPDGRYALVPAVDGLTLLNFENEEARLLLPFEAALPPSAGWSADSRSVYATAAGEPHGDLLALDVATGAAKELGACRWTTSPRRTTACCWSPGGAWVTWGDANGVLFLAQAAATQARRWSTVH